MQSAEALLELVASRKVKFIDLKFTDIRGRWYGLSLNATYVKKEDLVDGFAFDGSSFEGWVGSKDSDLLLRPNFETAIIDPMRDHLTVQIISSVFSSKGEVYSRDPRSVAIEAEEYLKHYDGFNGVSIGPELEFFMFDDVRFECGYNTGSFAVDDVEGQYNSNRTYSAGNLGNRTSVGQGLHIVEPADRSQRVRENIVMHMIGAEIPVTKHHHEGATSQHEIGVQYSGLVTSADRLQRSKHIAKNVAYRGGKSLTFMPKPVAFGYGSGMHINLSLNLDGVTAFSGEGHGGLSRNALYFIGGIFRHGKALNAICNASTNSYKRLAAISIAGPVFSYAARNRTSAIRIPHVSKPEKTRLEIRFPDASSNPYLAFAAVLMAGLDGIENSIDPGEPQDPNTTVGAGKFGNMASSLRESLECLNEDRSFLLKGGVFNNGLINAYLLSKNSDLQSLSLTPTPIEFQNYYSC